MTLDFAVFRFKGDDDGREWEVISAAGGYSIMERWRGADGTAPWRVEHVGASATVFDALRAQSALEVWLEE